MLQQEQGILGSGAARSAQHRLAAPVLAVPFMMTYLIATLKLPHDSPTTAALPPRFSTESPQHTWREVVAAGKDAAGHTETQTPGRIQKVSGALFACSLLVLTQLGFKVEFCIPIPLQCGS